MTKLSKGQADKLANIVAATNTEAGMCYMTEKSVQVLVDAGFVECNIAMTNPDDAKQVAVRATPTGMAYDPVEQAQPEGTEPMETPATAFAIEDGVKIPAIKRTGSATSVYPFDALAVGQSFFVPATEEMPNPGKSLASTVSSASKRYATENGTRTINRRNKESGEMEQVEVPAYDYERKFMVRSVEEDGVKGARVWRVEVEADDEE
jgi:hypothetical protein